MIHCAIMGSIERFLAVLLEHTEGRFPLWLAPEQLRILTLKDDKDILKMAQDVVKKAKAKSLRVELDDSPGTVSKKVHDAEVQKVPYTVVIGPSEIEKGVLATRSRKDLPEIKPMRVEELLNKLAQDAKTRS